jgi:excisionase family DNA binding protein
LEVSVNNLGPSSTEPTEGRYAYRPAEVARLLSLSRATIHALIKTGELRSRKVGKARLVPATEIARFAEKGSDGTLDE